MVMTVTFFKKFEISPPNAPAFIINAPPSVPGTPIKLSKPDKLLLIHSLTTLPNITPDSA